MDRATLDLPQARANSSIALDPRHSALAAWVRRRVGVIDHERRVLQIAEALFDLTQDLHGLGRRARWTLAAASLTHDVGRCIDPEDHPRVGAEMILTEPSLNLPLADRRALAYLTRYHRGPVPEVGEDEVLRASDDRSPLLKVLGLLRTADTLDSRSIEPPHLLLTRRNRDLRISCLLRQPCSRAQKTFCRPKKFRLLEESIGCTVRVEVKQEIAEC